MHCQLDRKRGSKCCNITGITLRPHSHSSFDLRISMTKACLQILEIKNIFILLNNF